jgi:hypothetical protein
MSDTSKNASQNTELPTRRIRTAPLQRSIRSERKYAAQSIGSAERRMLMLQRLDQVLSAGLEALRSDDPAPAIGLRASKH